MEMEGNIALDDHRKNFEYDFNHPDVQAAIKIEPYHGLFEIFNIQDTEMITLVLAATVTITKNLGVFSKDEIYTELNYMSKEKKKKVVDYLIKRNWIIFNGVDFEVPDRVKSFIKFLFTSLVRGDISISDNISLILAELEMTEHYNLSDTDKDIAYHIALLGELHNYQDRMERIL